MNILINCSNLRQGGGIQVADSICSSLYKYKDHQFFVVLSSAMGNTLKTIESFDNVIATTYDLPKSLKSTLFLKDKFLDGLVSHNNCNVVLTVFGPSRWRPSVPHLCGFARAHILPMDTPYFNGLSVKERLSNFIVKKAFGWSANNYWTENPAVTTLLQQVFPKKKIFTVSNTYNQIFDNKSKWRDFPLPVFDGVTLLTITNAYPHKNLGLALEIVKVLRTIDPAFKFRFVFTIDKEEYLTVPEELTDYFCFIGKVDISECPSLYQQADIMFQPTLLECFTATYAEAMRMDVPIVTTSLSFAKGLCHDAALYFSPLSAKEAADNIYNLSTNTELRDSLITAGRKQLISFDTAEKRADKLMSILLELGE